MRKIDYFAGIPLCFLFTLFKSIKNVFIKPVKDKPRKVLFIELSEMGSVILAEPAMRKLRDTCHAELFFLIFQMNKESLDLLNTVEEKNIFVIREKNLITLVIDTFKYFSWVREHNIDTVIDLEVFSRYTALLAGFSGAKNRVGFYAFYNEGLYRGNLLTHKVAYNPHLHIAKNFMSMVNALFLNEDSSHSKIFIADSEIEVTKVGSSENEKDIVRQIIKSKYSKYDEDVHRIILVNANASDMLPQRRWDRRNYCALIQMLLMKTENTLIFLTGAPEEKEWLQVLVDMTANDRCINFAGAIKFKQLIPLYNISCFMITNDSGPNHFASITKMPTFVIFGPETPKLYGSLGDSTPIYAGLACSPCVSAANHRKTSCENNICLQVLTPEHVYKVIEPSLF